MLLGEDEVESGHSGWTGMWRQDQGCCGESGDRGFGESM